MSQDSLKDNLSIFKFACYYDQLNEIGQKIIDGFMLENSLTNKLVEKPREEEKCICESGYGVNGICGSCGKDDGTNNKGTLKYGFRKTKPPKFEEIKELGDFETSINIEEKMWNTIDQLIRNFKILQEVRNE